MTLPAFSSRQQRILNLTERQGFVTIENLADEFNVSAQTIRRDIITLSEAGRLQRFHGGAGVVDTKENLRLNHHQKAHISVDAKRKVATSTADLIPDGASVFLDVGTTVEFTAEALNEREGLKIFTNSIRAALAFDPSRHDVNVLGGRMTGRDGSLTGEEIIAALHGLNFDYALIACSGIEDGGRVMDYDMSKIAVKKSAMRAARRSLLLATPSKFGRSALATIAILSDFDEVIDGEGVPTAGENV
ncbi:DeoR/GlpR family DNA-binding transcription regulator [Breoghania sp.]|uniref:DeoR/GlpR family DNA-binding transcription regulator n=1 Tax=Breoghania sp. TaxID=2065378 RepID=UPI0026048D6B|nr:DeoR/GlpR family DNA-binding transcription regulator [Breoghania sp.]MDJ0933027.1 DeoR/GlpR family DNA-binding transcription regulator [Breoghania sp.]